MSALLLVCLPYRFLQVLHTEPSMSRLVLLVPPHNAVADARAAASKCNRTIGLSEERLGSADYLSGSSVLYVAEAWT